MRLTKTSQRIHVTDICDGYVIILCANLSVHASVQRTNNPIPEITMACINHPQKWQVLPSHGAAAPRAVHEAWRGGCDSETG